MWDKSLGNAIAAEPTVEAPYSETLLYGSDLHAVEYIARMALLLALAECSTNPLDRELFELRRKYFQPQVEMRMSVTLPRGVPVGLTQQPAQKEGEDAVTSVPSSSGPANPDRDLG
jgi:hypothetical protein